MLNKLFHHQKLNFKISYRFRNKYFIIFPLYFSLIFTICLISYFTKFFFKRNFKLSKPVFITFSKNQSKVAKTFDASSEEIYINFPDFKIQSKLFKTQKLINFYLSNGISLSFLLSIFKIRSIKYFKINWFRIVNLVILNKLLNKDFLNHKLIVIANDHSIYNNFIIEFCKKENIKVMYIQHAPVTINFPPLRSNYNILFSESSKDIYSKISKIDSSIFIGIYSDFRLVDFLNIKKTNNVSISNTILVCTNELDRISRVSYFVNFFINKNYKITIRKHPADRRNWKIKNTKLSDKSLFEDFENNEIILCNETALILEAIVAKKLVYKCKFSEFIDNYSYVKEGLVSKQYLTPDELFLDICINFIAYNAEKIKYYTGNLKSHKSHILRINKLISSH